jgi:peptidoglycan hydrolase CwlO-like protein
MIRYIFFIFLFAILLVFIILSIITIYRNVLVLFAKKTEQKIRIKNAITDKKIDTIEKQTKNIEKKIKDI